MAPLFRARTGKEGADSSRNDKKTVRIRTLSTSAAHPILDDETVVDGAHDPGLKRLALFRGLKPPAPSDKADAKTADPSTAWLTVRP